MSLAKEALFLSILLHTKYPQEFLLYILPTSCKGPKEKCYLKEVLPPLLREKLSLSLFIYLPSSPKEIVYSPYQPYEDPYPYIEKKLSQNQLLPLKIHLWEKKNPPPHSYNSFHLHSSLAYQEKEKTYLLSYKLLSPFYKKTFLQGKTIFQEEEFLPTINKVITQIQKALGGNYTATLKVSSSPSSSFVYIQGVYAGRTPLEIPYLPQGLTYKIRLYKKGYLPYVKKVFLKEKEKHIFIPLKPQKGEYTLKIQSIPTSAKVYLDGIFYGETPLTIEKLPKGEYFLELSYEDIWEEKILDLKENTHLSISLLSPLPRRGILGISYQKLSYISLGISIASIIGGVYFLTQQEKEEEKLFRYYQQGANIDVNKVQKNLSQYKKYSQIAFISGGIFFLGGISFYALYISSYEEEKAQISLEKKF